VRDTWRRVGAAMDAAVIVCTASDAERNDLQSDTGWAGANEFRTPNGIEIADESDTTPHAQRGGLISVGRIEPRKRQLELARAALATGTAMTFVGGENLNTPRYCREFGRVIAQSSGLLVWTGALDRSEVLDRFASSRVLINASWVEVQSLVDLEALARGCAVVSAPTGSTRERFETGVTVVNSDDVFEMLATASRIASQPATVPRPRGRALGWADIARLLRAQYAAIAAS
jgi:glycosyltransferase involved in cell wall biosynthesis